MINFWSGQNAVNLRHTKADELMAALIAETGALYQKILI